MNFTADKQTLDDLNIPGKYKQHSVFRLFNQVHTAGGEKLLQKMFERPLNNADEINSRISIFRYFQLKQLNFPFNNEEFAVAEDYLSGSGKSNMLSSAISLAGKKILGSLVKDADYLAVETGIRATIKMLNTCKQFLNAFTDDSDITTPDEGPLKSLKELFTNVKLNILLKDVPPGQISIMKVARYDHLLRNILRREMDIFTTGIYELDVYLTVSSVAIAKGFAYPVARPNAANVFEAAGMRHPGIANAVSNQVSFRQDKNLIFLTGANMAGKSTFMKALGINIYLAHMGFPVAATSMSFSVKNGLYSSINVPDDLNKGYSHFYAEVLRVKTVAQAVAGGQDLVVIFDELFKGTNVKDAYDATLAVTAEFARYHNCLFIISTHIVEVGEALQAQNDNIQFLYLPTIMKGKIPFYTYQLQSGISADRHGMIIIENEGILQMLEDSHN